MITRDSLENAIACVCASGGSTNAVLHLIALAHELDIELTMDDFERISRATPLFADLKPGGRFVATDLYAAGGVPVILKRLAEGGSCTRTRSRSPARRSARSPRKRPRPRARKSCAPSTTR